MVPGDGAAAEASKISGCLQKRKLQDSALVLCGNWPLVTKARFSYATDGPET